MGLFDGFKFWIGKQLAEIAFFGGIVALIVLWAVLDVLWTEWRRRKRGHTDG